MEHKSRKKRQGRLSETGLSAKGAGLAVAAACLFLLFQCKEETSLDERLSQAWQFWGWG